MIRLITLHGLFGRGADLHWPSRQDVKLTCCFRLSNTFFRGYIVVYPFTGALHGRGLKTYSVTQAPSTTSSAADDSSPRDIAEVLQYIRVPHGAHGIL